MKHHLRSVFLTLAAAGALSAAPVTFSGSSGNLAAAVTFEKAGSSLIVTLANTAQLSKVPADVLTAVFFDIGGVNPVLTPVSAVLPAGSLTCLNSVCASAGGLNVGGEWAYKANPGVDGREYGISSSGLGVFGQANFNGLNLEGPGSVGGMEYGLIAGQYQPNGGLAGNTVVKTSVVFTLSGFGGREVSEIGRVLFQYGTGLDEPRFPGDPQTPPEVPEPATMAAMGSGLVGLAPLKLRKR